MQGRTKWVVGFSDSGLPIIHCIIEGFLYVLGWGLVLDQI